MCSLVLLLCFFFIPGLAQTRPVQPPPERGDIGIAPANGDEATDRLARDMAKRANQERAAAVRTDTEKLLKLAVELKASVDKSNEHVLSVDVIKKAEEIEKLAHSVKDKMKGPN
jgi:nitric oxide reductase activation protein